MKINIKLELMKKEIKVSQTQPSKSNDQIIVKEEDRILHFAGNKKKRKIQSLVLFQSGQEKGEQRFWQSEWLKPSPTLPPLNSFPLNAFRISPS